MDTELRMKPRRQYVLTYRVEGGRDVETARRNNRAGVDVLENVVHDLDKRRLWSVVIQYGRLRGGNKMPIA